MKKDFIKSHTGLRRVPFVATCLLFFCVVCGLLLLKECSATDIKWIPNEDPSVSDNLPLSQKYRKDMKYVEELEKDPEFMKYYMENYNPDYTYQKDTNSQKRGEVASKQRGHTGQIHGKSLSMFVPLTALLPTNVIQYLQKRKMEITAFCSMGATLYLSSFYLDYQTKKTGLCSRSSPLRTMSRPPSSYLRRLTQQNSVISSSSVEEKFKREKRNEGNEKKYRICVGEGKELYVKLRQSLISNMKSMSFDELNYIDDHDRDINDKDKENEREEKCNTVLSVDNIYVSPDNPKQMILVCKDGKKETNKLVKKLIWMGGGYRYRLIPLKIVHQLVDEVEKQVCYDHSWI